MSQRHVDASVRIVPMMCALLLADITSTLEVSMLYSALPTIVRETGSISGAGWLITAYLLVQAGAAAIGGRLGDIFGRRKVLIGALILCAFGSATSAFASNLNWIIVGRAIQGASGAILPLCYGLVRENAPSDRSPFWVSVMSGAYALGGAFGFISGAAFSQYGHWQQVFYVTLILPMLAIAGVLLFVPKTVGRSVAGEIDLLGGVLFVPAVTGILLAVSLGPTWGWTSPATSGTLAASVLCLIGWAVYESRHRTPLIDVRLLGNRQIALSNGIYFCAGLGAVQIVLVLMMLMQQPSAAGVGLGLSAVTAALWKLPGNLCSGAGGPLAGVITKRLSGRVAAIFGAAVQVVAWLLVIVDHRSMASVIAAMMLSSFSSGVLLGAVPNLILEVAPPHRSSEATGISSVTRAIATAIGTQLMTSVLASSSVVLDGHRYPSEGSYLLAFWLITGVSSVAILLAIALPRRGMPRNVTTAVRAAQQRS